MLKKMDRITGVSGGSITLGYLALNWNKLSFDANTDIASNFAEVIANPLMSFCRQSLDIGAIIRGLLSPSKTIGDKIAEAYNERLFNGSLLEDVPSAGSGVPEFIFYATNYDTGSSVRITRDEIYDYKLGKVKSSSLLLSKAVAASSAFPPFFSPVILNTDNLKWTQTKYASLFDYQNGLLRNQLTLADGGLYDNMGIESIWKTDINSEDHFQNVFVCDAGAPLSVGYGLKPGCLNCLSRTIGLNRNWISQFMRMSDVMIEQQRALRKRQLMKNYQEKEYKGCYWGIATKINDYDLETAMASDSELTKNLASVPTRLTSFPIEISGQLVNWGYALTDAAMRAYVDNKIQIGKWPMSDYPL
jgi:NTE family protein